MDTRYPAALLVAALGGAALAGPLRTSHVAGEAEWILHVDVEALNESTLGEFLLDHADDLEINDIEEELGLDPTKDLFSVTVYGTGDPEEEAPVVILEMSSAVDELIEKLQEEEGYERLEVGGYRLHRWEQDGEIAIAHVRRADDGRRLVVMSEEPGDIVEAMEVIDGERTSLARRLRRDDDLPIARNLPRSGSLVFMYAAGMPWLANGDDPASQIVQRSDRMRFELRERGGEATADLTISARSESDAGNIGDVLRGLMALGELISGQDEEMDDVAEALAAISISDDGNDITITLRCDTDELQDSLEELIEHVDP
jgi:hypothetical protein